MGFNGAYLGVPPWDIGRPQREFVKLAEAGEVKGDVIDVGCGTGEHAIYLSSLGHPALGVDAAPRAIEKAKAKAAERGSKAEFIVADALDLGALGREFDTAIDCGLFHVFSDQEREVYASSLASALRPRGRYFMLCFSDKEPDFWGGPRRVSRQEILSTFSLGWRVDYIRPARFETFQGPDGGRAWLAAVSRTEPR
jgi:SAM-dependent methyltransferase